MKTTLLLISSLLASYSFSQITLTSTNFVEVGDQIRSTVDSVSSITVTAAGPNQTWNYSTILNQLPDTSTAVAPSSTAYAADFPTANLAIQQKDGNLAFINKSTAKVEIVGATFFSVAGKFSDPQTQLVFPMTYGDNFTDNFAYEAKGPGSSFGYPVDSGRIQASGVIKKGVDAWGTLITPLGSFDVLRVADTTITTQVLSFYAGGMWNIAQTTTDTTYTHSFNSNSTSSRLSLLSYDVDVNGNLAGRINWELTASLASVNELNTIKFSVYPNPTSDIVNIITEENITSIVLTNIAGQTVYSTKANIKRVDLSNVKAGNYLLTVSTANGTATKQITKN